MVVAGARQSYIDAVTTGICYTIGAGDDLRTGIAVAYITYKGYYRYGAVVCFIGNYRYICRRYIADALYIYCCRIAGRGIYIVIYCDSLCYIDAVATGICYTIGAGDNLGTGIAIRHITYKGYYRYGAVVCFIGNYRYICCRYIADALNANRCRIAGRGICIVIDRDSLCYIDAVATGICYTVGAGDDLRTGIAIAYITYKGYHRYG